MLSLWLLRFVFLCDHVICLDGFCGDHGADGDGGSVVVTELGEFTVTD